MRPAHLGRLWSSSWEADWQRQVGPCRLDQHETGDTGMCFSVGICICICICICIVARAIETLSYLEMVIYLSVSMQMIFMDCDENASSRLRRPQSYEICENCKALGTCQAKKNSPRGCGGVGAFYGLIFAAVCAPLLGTVQGEDLLLHANIVAPCKCTCCRWAHSCTAKSREELGAWHEFGQTMCIVQCTKLCAAALHISHKMCTTILDVKRNAYL